MINIPFFSNSSENFLGIDIGSNSIKIVELTKTKGGKDIVLQNYGQVLLQEFANNNEKEKKKGKERAKNNKGSFPCTSEEIAKALTYLLKETGINTNKAYFSLPDFASFFTSFNLPPMNDEEISSAVELHSAQYIPLPISEVSLDWFLDKKTEKEIKINLIAIPNEVIDQYQEISNLSGINITSLEGEMIPLTRAFARNKKGLVAIVDMGEQTTLLTMAENGKLKTTHSLEVAGSSIAQHIANAAKIEYNQARDILNKYGLQEKNINRVASSRASYLFSEVLRAINSFENQEGKKVEEIILAGGFSLVPGIVEQAIQCTGKKVIIDNCFADIQYPPEIENKINAVSQCYGIALGSALCGIIN